MADLKLNMNNLESEIKKLKREINNFKPYSKKFIQKCSQDLGGMNADFVTKMEKTLTNMKDTDAPKVVEGLEEYVKIAELVLKNFKQIDKKLKKTIKGG